VDPLRPSLVAVMVVVPAATATADPLEEIVATFVALDDHRIVRPVSAIPEASTVTALNATDCPGRTLGF
jgi:hypothetical protein